MGIINKNVFKITLDTARREAFEAFAIYGNPPVGVALCGLRREKKILVVMATKNFNN